MFRPNMLLLALLLPVGACGTSDRDAAGTNQPGGPIDAANRAASPTPRLPTARAIARSGPRSCAAEIGGHAAAQRVEVCRNVSRATHPPCNAANSCAMIEDEIARSCALFDGKGPPMPGCVGDPKGQQAAADVVRRYYAALDARDYGTAWAQWGDEGRPGQSFAAFEKGFADTRSTRVTIGTLAPGEGGAGSIFQAVPVTVEAVEHDGTIQRFTGSYVVRRVNDVPGASAAQLRWHIDSAKLRAAAPR